MSLNHLGHLIYIGIFRDIMYFKEPEIILKRLQNGDDFNKQDYIECQKKSDEYLQLRFRIDLQYSKNRENRKLRKYPKHIMLWYQVLILMRLKYKQIESFDLPNDVIGIIKEYLEL